MFICHPIISLGTAAIDAFFGKMDADGGGSLDFPELKSTMKAVKDASQKIDRRADELHAEAENERKKATFVQG